MQSRILKVSSIFVFFTFRILFAADTDRLILQLKGEYDNIDKIKASEVSTAETKNELSQIRQRIYNIKTQLHSSMNGLNNPVFFVNDIKLDDNLDLVDFYIYENTDNYYQAFARLKNKQNKYLEWVKLRYNMYKDGAFVGTAYTYIDFESYGFYGISPYKVSFIETYIDKYDFDRIDFQAEYDVENGTDDILWDQVLRLESVLIIPSGNYYKWQGIVRNSYNYSMTFPRIDACILKDGRMIAHDYTYLDMNNNEMPANSSGTFDSYIDLPDSYDEIKYYIHYALYSMEGSGNLPPNIPIFVKSDYSGTTRTNTTFNAFIIDPDRDRIDLSIDFGDSFTSTWDGNFISGNIANVQYPYSRSGDFAVRAKASDDRIETEWSENATASIVLSANPEIITTEITPSSYKKYYSFQLQYTGGIAPISWQIRNGTLPRGLSLNSSSGLISGTPLSSGDYIFSVHCIDSGIPAVSDSVSLQLVVNNQKPIITSPDSINTFVNTPVIYTASATDADNNAVTIEFLHYPDWLLLSNNTLTGTTPNQILETLFTLIASDGDLADTMVVFIAIRTKPLTILSKDIRDAVYKKEYHDSLNATGGLTPYSWSIINGNLPGDLQFNHSGIFSGVPNSSGRFQFTAQVQDSDNPPQTSSLAVVLDVINNSPQITSSDTVSIKKLEEFVYKASAIDPDGNEILYQFINYPSWLSISNSTIAGKVPLTASDTLFTLIATDCELSDTLDVRLLMHIIPLSILAKDLDSAVYKNEYHDTLRATGGLAPYSWSIINGHLPKGIELHASGVLSGMPNISGRFQFTAQVRDSDEPFQIDSRQFFINVNNNAPQIVSSDTISIRKLDDLSYTASAIDPDGNEIYYHFSNLPSWLAFVDLLIVGNVPLTASDTSFSLISSDGELADSMLVKILIKEPSFVKAVTVPTEFRMSENYPNPFNSDTRIKIDLPESIEIELSIHDINGKLLDKLHVGQLNAGSHIFTWRALDIPSGIYFMSLRSDQYSKVVKCTLLK